MRYLLLGMKIFRLERDREQFMYFTFDELDLAYKMDEFGSTQFGSPLTYEWVKPRGLFHLSINIDTNEPESYAVPDMTQFLGTPLIINDKVKSLLEPHVGSEGEFFDIDCETKPYWFFNTTISFDDSVIDLENSSAVYLEDPSQPGSNVYMGVSSLVFKADADFKGANLFTVKYDGQTQLYCTEDFKKFVEDNAITGMSFSDNYVPSPCETTQEDVNEAFLECGGQW